MFQLLTEKSQVAGRVHYDLQLVAGLPMWRTFLGIIRNDVPQSMSDGTWEMLSFAVNGGGGKMGYFMGFLIYGVLQC